MRLGPKELKSLLSLISSKSPENKYFWSQTKILDSFCRWIFSQNLTSFQRNHLFLIDKAFESINSGNQESFLSFFKVANSLLYNTLIDGKVCSLAKDLLLKILSISLIEQHFLSHEEESFAKAIIQVFKFSQELEIQHKVVNSLIEKLLEGDRYVEFFYNIFKKFSEEDYRRFILSRAYLLMNQLAAQKRKALNKSLIFN